MIWIIQAAAVLYLGVGACFAGRWFRHRDPLSLLLVAFFWPLLLFLALFTK